LSEASGGRSAFAEALFRTGALRFGRFTLPDGRSSSYFLDLGVVPSDPEAYGLAVAACEALAKAVGEGGFDAVAGVGAAGAIISSPLALAWRKPLLSVRKGEGQGAGRVVGAVQPGWRTLVIDDAVATGGTLAYATEALRRSGCLVKDAVVLVDRLEGGKGRLGAGGVRLSSFMDVKELVETLHASKKVTKADLQAVLKQVGHARS
jgi:orotate phosphoribosyltransferase